MIRPPVMERLASSRISSRRRGSADKGIKGCLSPVTPPRCDQHPCRPSSVLTSMCFGGRAVPANQASLLLGRRQRRTAAQTAVQNATQQVSAHHGVRPHITTEPAATIQVAAGSSGLAPAAKTGPRQDAAQETARRGHGWPGGREEVAGTGTEQTRFHSGKQGVESGCDAECDAISRNRVELRSHRLSGC